HQLSTSSSLFSFHAPPTTAIYTLSLHDALPISRSKLARLKLQSVIYREEMCNVRCSPGSLVPAPPRCSLLQIHASASTLRRFNRSEEHTLNSSHSQISYAVFCLKKKKKK